MTHSSTVFTIICPEQPVLLCYDCSIMVSLTLQKSIHKRKLGKDIQLKAFYHETKFSLAY